LSEYILNYIDAHVGGEPLRLILRGPILKGATLLEKRSNMINDYDYIRTAVVLEPRGHDDMYGAVVVDPCHPDADLGIVFFDGAYYNNMCGHGAIAIATIAVETGLVRAREPVTDVVVETGAGLVTVQVETTGTKAGEATLEGIPSFLYRRDISIELAYRTVMIDIGFGGNFFVIVEMDELGLTHSKNHIPDFIRYGLAIREEANKTLNIEHPEKPHINIIEDIIFVKGPDFPGDTHKNIVVLGHAMVDRSPCGTGTCARMASLHARGLLKPGDIFYHQSITGALFEGCIKGLTRVGDFPAIIPQVKGKAYITGMGTLMINPEDPLKYGFTLR